MLVRAYRASFGFPAIITRGSNTYGWYQYPEKIIPLFITNAVEDRPLPIYGDGFAVRDYILVEDHCRGIDTALRAGRTGEDYNVGAGGEVDGQTVANTVLRLLGKPESLKQPVADRPGHDRRYALDCAKLRALGWAPQVSFAAGMERTVAWYVEHPEWWRPLKSGEFWEFYQRNYKPLPSGAA
jgi:dTDP-glucose 4,6-dehydratase